MDKATELLNGLSGEEIAAYAASSSDDPHIVIGADRFINVPAALQKIGVQDDHQVNQLIFDCPRYWDGLDLVNEDGPTTPKFIFYINYTIRGTNGHVDAGRYTVEDVSVDANDTSVIHFSWPVSSHMTQVDGAITFSVCCIEGVDEENVTRWNSEPCADGLVVSKGLECLDATFEMYPSVMDRVRQTSEALDTSSEEHLIDRLDAVEIKQLNMQNWIGDDKTAIETESYNRFHGDIDITDRINAEAEARAEEDDKISERLDSMDIVVQDRTTDELRSMVTALLSNADFEPIEGPYEVSTRNFCQYRPYEHINLQRVDGPGGIVTKTYRLIDRGANAKCFNGVVTIYSDNRFHTSFTLKIHPDANPTSTNSSDLTEETQDIITREDLSRLIFGHNRAYFLDINGFWYPTDMTDGQYKVTYGDFVGGAIRTYEPHISLIPTIGSVHTDEFQWSRNESPCFLPPRAPMNNRVMYGLYDSLLCERLGYSKNISLSDFASKNLYLRFELTGRIENENAFEPYSEYAPSDLARLSQNVKDSITLNGVGNSVKLANMRINYSSSNMYNPSHSTSNTCDSHRITETVNGGIVTKYGDFCTHWLRLKHLTGKRAYLFEDGILVASTLVNNSSIEFKWNNGAKRLLVAYSYKVYNTTHYDYWRYENTDTSEQTSKGLTVLFDISEVSNA